MKILDTKVYRGPNLYALRKVIRLKVDLGELEDYPTNKLPGFVDRLLELMPTLHEHTCSYQEPGGFVRRMTEDEGTWLGHVLEHVANPIAALREWVRVLAHGGIIYMVVPDRRHTFDHRRPLTTAAHMLDDFRHGVTQSDGTHIDDFVYGVDWTTFSPSTPAAEEQKARDEFAATYRNAVHAGRYVG